VALIKTVSCAAGTATGLFQGMGIAAAAGKSYYLLVYASPSAQLLLADSAFATDPEATLPATFPLKLESAQFAVSPTDDVYLFNPGTTAVPVTVFAQLR
jgi:hypothetical protein